MNKPKAILPLILLLLWSSNSFAQERDLKKIIVTSPEMIIVDDSIKEYLIDYENTFYLSSNEDGQHYYMKKSKKKKFPDHVKKHLQYQASFSQSHTVANSVTSLVAHYLQLAENNENYNLLSIPINYSPGYKQDELEKLCTQDSADFIILVYMVKFTMQKEKKKCIITADPSFYLYSHHDKKVVYNPQYPKQEGEDALGKLFAKSIGGVEKKNYRFIMKGAQDFRNILDYLNQWQPSPSI